MAHPAMAALMEDGDGPEEPGVIVAAALEVALGSRATTWSGSGIAAGAARQAGKRARRHASFLMGAMFMKLSDGLSRAAGCGTVVVVEG